VLTLWQMKIVIVVIYYGFSVHFSSLRTRDGSGVGAENGVEHARKSDEQERIGSGT